MMPLAMPCVEKGKCEPMGHSRTCSFDVLASKSDRCTTRTRAASRSWLVGRMELMMNAAKADEEK
jgi:hypothetical protein